MPGSSCSRRRSTAWWRSSAPASTSAAPRSGSAAPDADRRCSRARRLRRLPPRQRQGTARGARPERHRRDPHAGGAPALAARPDERDAADQPPGRAVTRDGRTIRGRRLNEDTYTRAVDRRAGTARLARESRPARVRAGEDVADAVGGRHVLSADEQADLVGLSPLAEGAPMNDRHTMRRCRSSCCSRRCHAPRAGVLRSPAARGVGAAQLADLLGQLRQPALQPARSGHARQRRQARAQVDAAEPGVRRLAVEPARRRRHHVRHAAARTTCWPLDAKTGRVFWLYRYTPSPDARVCCGSNNRGVAILGDTLFMGTLDAHLIAIDAKSGRPLWNIARRRRQARLLDHAGAARREGQGHCRRRRRRVRHPRLHRRATTRRPARRRGGSTRFPAPASRVTTRGRATPGRPAAARCGSPARTTRISTSPTGASAIPGPTGIPISAPATTSTRDSVVALDADTGKLKWHFQFTPNDAYDYDSVQVPVLVDMNWRGRRREADAVGEPQRLLLRPRSRHRHAFCSGNPFVKVNWASASRRTRAADSDAAAAGQPDVARQPGRHQLVSAVATARAPSSSTSPRGRTTRRSTARRRPSYQPGRNFSGGGFTVLTPVPGAPGDRHRPAQPDQQLDRRSRPRRGDRDRSATRASRSGSSISST